MTRSTRPPRRASDAPEDPNARRVAGQALGSAYRVLKQLRVVFVVDAVLIAFALLIALSTDSLLAKAICGALFVAAVAGAIYVVRYPVPSTIALAIVHTPPALLAIGIGGAGSGRILVMGLAAVIWCCVPMALRTRKIMDLHPDLWAARAMRGEHREPGRIGRKYRDQARAHRKRRLLRVLLFGVLPLVLLIAGNSLLRSNDAGTAARESSRPSEPLLPTALRFREAWNGSRHDEVKGFLADSEHDRISRLLDKSWRRKAWDVTLPPAAAPELIEFNERQWYAHFRIDGHGLMKTSWEWEDTAWVLVRILFRKNE